MGLENQTFDRHTEQSVDAATSVRQCATLRAVTDPIHEPTEEAQATQEKALISTLPSGAIGVATGQSQQAPPDAHNR